MKSVGKIVFAFEWKSANLLQVIFICIKLIHQTNLNFYKVYQ